MFDDGIDVKIHSKNGNKIKSSVNIYERFGQKQFTWRKSPELLECAVSFVGDIAIEGNILTLSLYGNESLKLEFLSVEKAQLVLDTLKQLSMEATDKVASQDSFAILSDKIMAEMMLKSEDAYCRLISQKFSDGIQRLDTVLSKKRTDILQSVFGKWAARVQESNKVHMEEDRSRWRRHALANQGLDLQAWYHAIYYKEVYRPRGLFWYRDAVLPVYRSSYDLVDHSLSALEEAALAHVLCSPETSYGDVAGQMFVVQALVSRPALFTLFQKLTAQGMSIAKVPSSGQISKKLFRFSFVEGSIYFTWVGKYGNQGVDLLEVSEVTVGRVTDTLRKNGSDTYQHLYLSIFSKGKSIDLCFVTTEERNDFKDLFDLLMNKELGRLSHVPPLLEYDESTEEKNSSDSESSGTGLSEEMEREWLTWYSSIGARVLPESVKAQISARSREIPVSTPVAATVTASESTIVEEPSGDS